MSYFQIIRDKILLKMVKKIRTVRKQVMKIRVVNGTATLQKEIKQTFAVLLTL